MKCDHEYGKCTENAIVVITIPATICVMINDRNTMGSSVYVRFCASHMRDFYRYVADQVVAAERADEEAERASR